MKIGFPDPDFQNLCDDGLRSLETTTKNGLHQLECRLRYVVLDANIKLCLTINS